MRRTLTIEEDVDAALEYEMRESGRPFKDIVNETLRNGLLVKEASRSAPPLRIRPLSMGLKPGLLYFRSGSNPGGRNDGLRLLDAKLLIYAFDDASPMQDRARTSLERVYSEDDLVGRRGSPYLRS